MGGRNRSERIRDGASHEPRQGELGDPDRHVQRQGLLGARRVSSAGREVQTHPRFEQERLRAGVGVQLPLLASGGLYDEHVVGVGMLGETLSARGREVGVGLARVAELLLEFADEGRDRRPIAVQPLEDDRGPGFVQVEHLARVEQSGHHAAGKRRAHRV